MMSKLRSVRRLPAICLIPLLLAAAVGRAYADPGDLPDYGQNGAADFQSWTGNGGGNQTAYLGAIGGEGETGYFGAGDGGAASAVLDLTADWLAAGSVTARGGDGGRPGPDNWYFGRYGTGADGTASAVLRGAGAVGAATAYGGAYRGFNPAYPSAGSASSSITAWTSGAMAVDLSSNAYSGSGGGSSTATLYVDSGVAQPAAGNASVTGRVSAIGSGGYETGDSRATLTLYGNGSLSGTSMAQAADSINDPYTGGSTAGGASSSVIGVTRGNHDVTLNSSAKSGNAAFFGAGAADATVSGQSGSGKVLVKADANANMTQHQDSRATALATARTTEWGGVSEAHASALGDIVSARAQAYSVGGNATAVASGAGLTGSVSAESGSSGSNRAVLASASGTVPYNAAITATAQTAFGGASPALPVLGSDPMALVVAIDGGAAGVGSGAQAALLGDDLYYGGYVSLRGEHQWQSDTAQHLWINLLGATAVGEFYALDFSITNNGAVLYSHSFGSVEEANLFFNNHLLDLGALAAGAQDLVITSGLSATSAGFGFNYTLAVPEPMAWLLMLSGLTVVMLAARRKSKAGLGAPDLFQAKAGGGLILG